MKWTLETNSSARIVRVHLFDNILSRYIYIFLDYSACCLSASSYYLFVSYGDGSSTHEVVFHGVPLLVIPYNGDQMFVDQASSTVDIRHMHDYTKSNFVLIKHQMYQLLLNTDGSIAHNLRCMQTLVQIGSKRLQLT